MSGEQNAPNVNIYTQRTSQSADV